ncbi:hypothetical protein HAX54_043196 [Datura stramonium]|uniref:Uncharacterized protein n=1 Tax=Datura stramonium TaxID=4076 RepID=A0ABS8W2T9_DATST|nr:hypothetical protein [Datura stramonium]
MAPQKGTDAQTANPYPNVQEQLEDLAAQQAYLRALMEQKNRELREDMDCGKHELMQVLKSSPDGVQLNQHSTCNAYSLWQGTCINLPKTYRLARLAEATIVANQRAMRNSFNTLAATRKLDLYLHQNNAQYTKGHKRVLIKQLFVLELEDTEDEGLEEVIVDVEDASMSFAERSGAASENPIISLYALSGIEGAQTIHGTTYASDLIVFLVGRYDIMLGAL